MLITLGIGARRLESSDGGRNWTEGTRPIPPPNRPVLRGVRDGLRLPAPAGWSLSHVFIGAGGVGFAAGSEPTGAARGRTSNARFWRTRDAGATWEAMNPDIGFWDRLRAWPSWPPESVDAVAVLAGGLFAFAWEDPWIYDNPHTHIAISTDGGSRWRCRRLPVATTGLAQGPGPLRVFGGPRIVQWSGSRLIRGDSTRFEWQLPPGYWSSPVPLRSVQFTSETDGYALVVSWPRDHHQRPAEELPPPLVGLASTRDGGRIWRMVNMWEGPRSVDLNRRHELALDVH